jgi:hypothetical protein
MQVGASDRLDRDHVVVTARLPSSSGFLVKIRYNEYSWRYRELRSILDNAKALRH